MTRKIFILSLILSISISLIGCGGGAKSLLGGITGTALPAGVTITIGTTSTTATSASDGSYSFSNVNAGAVTLNFTKTGYASQTKTVTVTAGATANVAAVTLTSSYGGVAGTVELSGEADHSGISISISVNGYSGTATTNSTGSYSFSNLSPGTVTLNFSKSGYVSATTVNTVVAAATTNISTVTLNVSKGSVTGKATLSGTAAADISVTLNGTSTTTDSNGNFSFSNVAPGTYTLTYGKSGYTSQTQQVTVTAGQATDAGTVNLTLSTGSITGKVLLDGKSIHTGITVTVTVNGTALTDTTIDDGTFTISDVPTGTHTLTASKSGYVSSSTSNISVEAAQATDIGTITLYESATEYSMDSLGLLGTPSAMTYYKGHLIIATDEKLYKVSTSNPTTYADSVTVTNNNYATMMAGNITGPGDCILAYYQAAPSSVNVAIYNENLDDPIIAPQQGMTTVIPAGTVFNIASVYIYSNSTFTKIFVGAPGDPTNNYSVNETGIISLKYSNNYFYACDSTTIYKYNLDFDPPSSLTASLVGAGTDLVGIVHDGTYIWVIDATTKKLYKITDDL